MVMRIKREAFIYTLVILGMILFCWTTSRPIEYSMFIINLTLMVTIIGMSQFSLFSLIAILTNYVLINVFFVYTTRTGYGLLALTSNINMKEINIIIFVFNLSVLFWVIKSDILAREKKFLDCDIGISKNICIVLAFLSMLFAYIAFPGFQFGITANRFQALLPGHFWNHVMLLLLIVASTRAKESHLIRICILSVTAWVLFHGERVDIIGFYSFVLIRYCSNRGYRINLKFWFRFSFIFLVTFVGMIYIGIIRAGGNADVRIDDFLSSIIAQGTASDVGYVLNCAVDFIKEETMLKGKTYITYIQGIIPFIDQPLRAGFIIQKMYHTAGGEFILVEPYINFGYWGVAIIPNLIISIIYIYLKRESQYKIIVYFFLVATAFRYMWYGLTYIQTAMLYLIPITYWGLKLVAIKRKSMSVTCNSDK